MYINSTTHGLCHLSFESLLSAHKKFCSLRWHISQKDLRSGPAEFKPIFEIALDHKSDDLVGYFLMKTTRGKKSRATVP